MSSSLPNINSHRRHSSNTSDDDDESSPQKAGGSPAAMAPSPPPTQQQRKPAQTARSNTTTTNSNPQQTLAQAKNYREILHLPNINEKQTSVTARLASSSSSPHQQQQRSSQQRQSQQQQSAAPSSPAAAAAAAGGEQPLPFQVPESADGIAHLPGDAWTPRENTAEERRRLQLLELYWNNANPHVNGLFSAPEPIDRLISRFQLSNGADGAVGLPPGSPEGKLIATLRQSVLLNQVPRSNLQRTIDFALDKRSERKRDSALKKAARRALQQDDSDGDSDKNDDDDDAQHHHSPERRAKEKEQRAQEQDVRKEELRKRFFAGDVFDENDVNWRRSTFGPLQNESDVGLNDRRRRAQMTKNNVAKQAQAMRDAAEARRMAAIRRKEDDEKERKRRAAHEKQQRGAETEADKQRRELLAQKKRERLQAMEDERERLRREKAEADARKADKAERARQAARARAEEQERERQEKLRLKREAEEARRTKEEEEEAEHALKRKKSMSHTEPKYEHDGPDREKIPVTTRKVYECFDDGTGQLFRVVETDPAIKGKRWHFYNDTAKTTFHVKIFFVPPCSVRPIGEAEQVESELEGERGEVVISVKVPPLQTVSFSEGQVKQFSAEIDAEEEASREASLSAQGSASMSMGDDQEGQTPISGAPNYKHGAPEGIEAPYEVYECFEGEGILFRIVKRFPETGTQQWWYYNDDDAFGMKIVVKFGPKSDITPLGDAKMRKLESTGQWEVTAEVGTVATIPFISGKVNGFIQEFDIIEQQFNSPSPMRKLDRKKSMSGAERRNYVKELQDRAAELVQQFGDFAAEKQLAGRPMLEEQELLLATLKAKHFFIDPHFPPVIESVSTDEDQQADLADLCWLKAEDFVPPPAPNAGPDAKPKKAAPIAGNTVSASDIQAGAIADWWILSAIGVLAQTPFRITQLFKNHPLGPAVEKREVSQGIYRVRMLVGGWWTDVVVDDWMPVEIDARGRPSLFFAHSAKGPHELWVSLIEKAFAKTSADHCFTELGNGDSLHIIEDLTGFPCVRLDPRLHPEDVEEEEDGTGTDSDTGDQLQATTSSSAASLEASISGEEKNLFKDFCAYLARGWLVMLNTAQQPDDDDELDALTTKLTKAGLEVDCTYKVVDAKEVIHLGKTHRLVRISNPWGKGTEWKGMWGWGHTEWKRIPSAWKTCHPDPVPLPMFGGDDGGGGAPGLVVGGGDDDGGLSLAVPSIGISVGGGDDDDVPMISVGGGAAAPAASSSSGKRKNSKVGATTSSPTADDKKKVGKSPDDSTFWMEWRDVKKHFSGAGVCYLENDWHDYRIPGKFVDGHPSIGLEVRCTERTRAFLLLMQPAGAGFDEAHPDSRYAGCMLSIASRRPDEGDFEIKMNSDLYFDKPSRDLTFVVGRSLGAEYVFEPSDDQVHLIVPRCFSKTANKDYVLAIILDQPVGEDVISFQFRSFKQELGIFDGFPTFTYSRSQHSNALDDQWFQYKPPNGRPQRNCGSELEGAPSDLVAGRAQSRLGAQSSMGSPQQSNTAVSNASLSGSASFGPVGTFRPVSSMSFDILTDVLVHFRNTTELPFEVNAIAAYDFHGMEVFRTTKLLTPATRTPNWSSFDLEASAPLGYVWNDEHRNLTFRLLYVDAASGETSTMCEGKSTWDDATVAAKLQNEQGSGKRPVVSLRLRLPPALRQSQMNALQSQQNALGGTVSGSSTSKDVVGSLSVSFSAVSRTTELSGASYFTVVIAGASSFKQKGNEDDDNPNNVATTHVVVHSGKAKGSDAIFVSGDSMAARPGEVMFMGHSAECVLHNNGHGFLLQVRDAEKADEVYAEAVLTLQKLVELSGSGPQQVELNEGSGGGVTGDGKKPWVRCTIQAFRSDN